MVTTAAWKKLRFIFSNRSDFHMTDSRSIAVYAFTSRIFIFRRGDASSEVNLITSFREPLFSVAISPLWLKHTYSVLSAFTWRRMLPTARSRLCSWDSARVGVFARSAMSSAESQSVIVHAEYRLLLAFSSVSQFPFIKYIDIQST